MKTTPFALLFLILMTACSSHRSSEIHIDSNTDAFEKIVNPPSSANIFKYEFFMEGYSDDTIMINGSKMKGEIKFNSDLCDFYGDPPMKVIYDPLKAKEVNIDIEYLFY